MNTKQKLKLKKEKYKMGRITFSEQDIKRGTIVEPGWYLCEITDYNEKEAQKDHSTNYVIDFKIISSKNPEVNGVPLRNYFNEKGVGFMKRFIEVFSGGKIEVGKSYELSVDLIGKQLMVNVIRGEYNGAPQNQASDYAPVGAVPASA